MATESMFLDNSELHELTGRVHRKKQVEILAENGIFFTLDANGSPRVPRNYAEIMNGGRADFEEQPNFEAI